MTDFEKQLLEKIEYLQTDVELLLNKTIKPDFIFVVIGSEINKNRDNIKVIKTLIVPNINEHIFFNKRQYLVTGKVINYQQVFEYEELSSEGRGGEMITVFVK